MWVRWNVSVSRLIAALLISDASFVVNVHFCVNIAASEPLFVQVCTTLFAVVLFFVYFFIYTCLLILLQI